jgi:transposase-like protein
MLSSNATACLQTADDLADTYQQRLVQYLNNILEQDHRAIKRPSARQPGFPLALRWPPAIKRST